MFPAQCRPWGHAVEVRYLNRTDSPACMMRLGSGRQSGPTTVGSSAARVPRTSSAALACLPRVALPSLPHIDTRTRGLDRQAPYVAVATDSFSTTRPILLFQRSVTGFRQEPTSHTAPVVACGLRGVTGFAALLILIPGPSKQEHLESHVRPLKGFTQSS